MKRLIGALVVLWGLMLVHAVPAWAAHDIEVRFSNDTDLTVAFFLNGGDGLETELKAGKSREYTMTVDKGTPPTVKIYQLHGEPREFSVEDGGRYVFKYKNGGIENYVDD